MLKRRKVYIYLLVLMCTSIAIEVQDNNLAFAGEKDIAYLKNNDLKTLSPLKNVDNVISDILPAKQSLVSEAINFKDPAIKKEIFRILKKSENDVVTKEEMRGIYRFSLPNAGVKSVEDLSYCVNIRDLNLDNNMISDISPL